mgnify:CR=1 FL=1
MINLIKIENDCYFVAQRLKEIDDSYEVYFNTYTNSYEVHSSEQAKNSYCFKVPFDYLDERTVDYARKTRAANRDNLIKEIERNNQLIYENNIKICLNKIVLWIYLQKYLMLK